MEAWLILLPAFVLCALMILTHTYLGLHVLARGIIFVDLALAQVAAMGVSIAFLLGWDLHGFGAQLIALSSTLLAAILLAKLRDIPDKTAREVIIGCLYVVATAISIVVLSRSSQGMEELKSMFSGNILWVRWQEIGLLFVIYTVLAAFHSIFFRRFYALSFNERDGEKTPFIWELLFFVSFALVITFAVNLAGVLMVFAFLIIPAFSASLLAQSFLCSPVARLGDGDGRKCGGAMTLLGGGFTNWRDCRIGVRNAVALSGSVPRCDVGSSKIKRVCRLVHLKKNESHVASANVR